MAASFSNKNDHHFSLCSPEFVLIYGEEGKYGILYYKQKKSISLIISKNYLSPKTETKQGDLSGLPLHVAY